MRKPDPDEEFLDALGPAKSDMRAEEWDAYGPPPPPEPVTDALTQLEGALYHADRPADGFLHWPYGSIDELTGGMTGGQVWFVAGFRGKTTFLLNVLDHWISDGARVYGMALETTRDKFRLMWAALRVGVDGGTVLNGTALPEIVERVRAEIRAMRDELDLSSRMVLHPAHFLTPLAVREALTAAKEWGADLFTLDHADHLRPDPTMNTYQQSVDIIAELHDQALKHDLLVIATTQLNDNKLHNRNRLARFAPPIPALVFNGTHKYNVSTGMLGLYKPLRSRRMDEKPEEFKAALTAVRDGDAEPQTVLEKNVMGVTLMKGRHGVGQNEGRQAVLRFENGKLSDIPIREYGRYDV